LFLSSPLVTLEAARLPTIFGIGRLGRFGISDYCAVCPGITGYQTVFDGPSLAASTTWADPAAWVVGYLPSAVT